VVLLVTEQVLLRPWCICELVTAVSHNIPITVVKVTEGTLPDLKRLKEGLDLLLTFKYARKIFSDNDIKKASVHLMFEAILLKPQLEFCVSGAHGQLVDQFEKIHRSACGVEAGGNNKKKYVAETPQQQSTQSTPVPLAQVPALVPLPKLLPPIVNKGDENLAATKIQAIQSKAKVVPDLSQSKDHHTGMPALRKLLRSSAQSSGVETFIIHNHCVAARIIQVMALRDESKTKLALEQDVYSTEKSALAVLRSSSTVVVLLTGGFLDNAEKLVQLAIAHRENKHLVPVIVETANATLSFSFPDDRWYLQDLPDIHARNQAIFDEFSVPAVALAEAVQTLLLKIAPRFSENESGRVQRASIRTIISRIEEPANSNEFDSHHGDDAFIFAGDQHRTNRQQGSVSIKDKVASLKF